MTTDKRVPLVSATGSIRMGRIVAQAVADRFGKSLLELGGNNAIILTESTDLKMSSSWSCIWSCRNLRTTLYFNQKINYSRIVFMIK